MGFRVYFKDAVETHSLFKTEIRGGRDDRYTEHSVCDMRLKKDEGRWCHDDYGQPMDSVPPALRETGLIDGFSYQVYLHSKADREAGIYEHNSARAEVDRDLFDNKPRLRITIKAKELIDLHALYEAIRSGSMRPKKSYDGPQCGLSREDLQVTYKRAVEETESARETIQSLMSELGMSRAALDGALTRNRELDRQRALLAGVVKEIHAFGAKLNDDT